MFSLHLSFSDKHVVLFAFQYQDTQWRRDRRGNSTASMKQIHTFFPQPVFTYFFFFFLHFVGLILLVFKICEPSNSLSKLHNEGTQPRQGIPKAPWAGSLARPTWVPQCSSPYKTQLHHPLRPGTIGQTSEKAAGAVNELINSESLFIYLSVC